MLGTIEEIEGLLDKYQDYVRPIDILIEYHNLTMSTYINENAEVNSVGSILKSVLYFWQTQEPTKIDILSELTGRILPGKMTLLLGPPGSGKTGKSICMYTCIFAQYMNKCAT